MTRPNSPNAYIVFGGASHAIQDFIQNLDPLIPMVRVFRTKRPTFRTKAIDINSMEDLPIAISHLSELIEEEPLRLGVLGAGFASQRKLLIQESPDDIDRMIQTNIRDYIDLTQVCLGPMIKSRFGRFVYLSSFRANTPTRGVTIYSASKAFGEAFFENVAVEYGRFGITATSIRMGFFAEGLLASVPPERLESFRMRAAVGHLGTGEQLSAAIAFAMSAGYASGGVIDFLGALDHG